MSTIPVYNPTAPYLGLIPGGLHHGKIIRLKGVMGRSGTRFNANILTGPALRPRDDVNLHISVRPAESAIVRNHYANLAWGTEERFGSCPINYNQYFDIMILAEMTQFKIAINGIHFCTFNHRLPLSSARYVSIDGDAQIQSITVDSDVGGGVHLPPSHEQPQPFPPQQQPYPPQQQPYPQPYPPPPPYPGISGGPHYPVVPPIHTYPGFQPIHQGHNPPYNPGQFYPFLRKSEDNRD